MILLRLLALLAGGLVLIVPPMVAAQSAHSAMPAWAAVGSLTGLSLVSLSFLYIAALGDRMRRSGPARTTGGLLLAIPAVAGIFTLATRKDPELLWCSGILLAFTVVMFLSFVLRVVPEHRQRPMRRRERVEPSIVLAPPQATSSEQA